MPLYSQLETESTNSGAQKAWTTPHKWSVVQAARNATVSALNCPSWDAGLKDTTGRLFAVNNGRTEVAGSNNYRLNLGRRYWKSNVVGDPEYKKNDLERAAAGCCKRWRHLWPEESRLEKLPLVTIPMA